MYLHKLLYSNNLIGYRDIDVPQTRQITQAFDMMPDNQSIQE